MDSPRGWKEIKIASSGEDPLRIRIQIDSKDLASRGQEILDEIRAPAGRQGARTRAEPIHCLPALTVPGPRSGGRRHRSGGAGGRFGGASTADLGH